MKYLLAFGFAAIVASLAAALFFMLRSGRAGEADADDARRSGGPAPDDDAQGKRMATALALRVGLSVALFLCLLLAWWLGYIRPSGFG